jgi:hypothetical protein
MRGVRVGLVVLAALAAGADERPPGPGQYGFVLHGGVLGKLGLSEEQKAKVLEALRAFVTDHRKELDQARRDFQEARAAAEKARKDEDRDAFRKAQERVRKVEQRVAKWRDELEPKVLAALTEAQKKRYQELKKTGGGPGPILADRKELAKLKPLTELGSGEYQGFKGGLYPGGKNERPAAHEAAGLALAKKVRPLDAAGKPDPKGKVVLLSVGMSNTSQAFTALQRLVEADEAKNPALVLVNGAQGGMTAARIQDPESESGAKYWAVVDRRLKEAGVTRAQVQAVWIKQADAGPSQGFPKYARTLEAELARIVQLLPGRFPNLKLAYLSSRTYGGFARTKLNPEPYAYESGFSVKWLIERQLKGEAGLNYDPAKGKVRAPWLSWGPYLWAGVEKRADGFIYTESDYGADGTHPSAQGQRKIAGLMLKWFKADTTTKPWFVKE